MKEKKKDVIILTRMYAGGYLKDKIGHEIINLFKADNGKNYIYINHDGKINRKYNDRTLAIFLVRWLEKGVMEVMAKAEELTQILKQKGSIDEESKAQIDFINANNIKYGGVLLHEVRTEDSKQAEAENLSITFETKKLRKVRKPFFLIKDKNKISTYRKRGEVFFLRNGSFATRSLKMYYPKTEKKQDYETLEQVLKNNSLWDGKNNTKRLNTSESKQPQQQYRFLSIIKKEDDELVFSNILAYLFKQNKALFVNFAKKVLKIKKFKKEFNLEREKEHIDLWIEDDNNVIIIENKIKSKINGKEQNKQKGEAIKTNKSRAKNQLDRYYKAAQQKSDKKALHCFIFVPNYNVIDLKKEDPQGHYIRITYKQIYEFYSQNKEKMSKEQYINEFIGGLYLHAYKTVAEHNFEIMRDRFIEKIKEIKKNKNL